MDNTVACALLLIAYIHSLRAHEAACLDAHVVVEVALVAKGHLGERVTATVGAGVGASRVRVRVSNQR